MLIDNEEYMRVLNALQLHHSLFSTFWRVGSVVESEAIPTMAVSFDSVGQGVVFTINPKFWNELDLYTKTFCIAHECVHVFLNTGYRGASLQASDPSFNVQIFNIAADLVDNHYLEDYFGFDRTKLSIPVLNGGNAKESYNNLCWAETIFPDGSHQKGHTLEYYYNALMENAVAVGVSFNSMDNHDQLIDDGKEELEGKSTGTSSAGTKADQISEKVLSKIVESISPEESKVLKDLLEDESKQDGGILAGTTAGNIARIIALKYVVKKKKWETIIHETLGRYKGEEKPVTIDQWVFENRRFSILDKSLLLPAEYDIDVKVYDRLDVWLFQDTSGSCEQFAERFFKAAASIPEHRFNVRMFCFDTRVFETTLKSGKLYGFGGTCFRCIEDEITKITSKPDKNNRKVLYPQYVFVITDGYGTNVSPKYPDRWHWFLTPYSTTYHIPKQSKTYNLSDFE